MDAIFQFFGRLLSAALRVVLWLLAMVLALGLLSLALLLLLGGVLWALVRGKRPEPPVVVGRFRQFATQRVWPGRPGAAPTSATQTQVDVVDVEVREVRDVPEVQDAPRDPPPRRD